MTDTENDSDELRDTFAKGFETRADPLQDYESTFRCLDADPFNLFVRDALLADDTADQTINQYRIAFNQWKTYMEEVGRHPACPNDSHVCGFAHWLQKEQDNGAIATIRQKLHKLNRAYRYWQWEPTLPHTTGYDPIAIGREQLDWATFEDTSDKSPPPIPLDELRIRLSGLTDLRTQIQLVTQIKLGLRVGELSNMQLQDVNLTDQDLQQCYPDLGTHDCVTDRPNAAYIPSKRERDGNKSRVSRALPLDEELQELLRRYLRVRPTWVDDWLFVSDGGRHINGKSVNKDWKETFHPTYAETAEYRAVTSHFARHYFTTYWRKERGLKRELVQYLRGDVVGDPALDRTGMHHYLHAYYEDIESTFRRDIYKLRVTKQ